MTARSERIRVKGVPKREMSPTDIELYSLSLWLGAKRQLRDRRRHAEAAKERKSKIARRREDRHER
jgi:hypothetical protein